MGARDTYIKSQCKSIKKIITTKYLLYAKLGVNMFLKIYLKKYLQH